MIFSPPIRTQRLMVGETFSSRQLEQLSAAARRQDGCLRSKRYYYTIDPPQGFASRFSYERRRVGYALGRRRCCCHMASPRVGAPGYRLSYLWGMLASSESRCTRIRTSGSTRRSCNHADSRSRLRSRIRSSESIGKPEAFLVLICSRAQPGFQGTKAICSCPHTAKCHRRHRLPPSLSSIMTPRSPAGVTPPAASARSRSPLPSRAPRGYCRPGTEMPQGSAWSGTVPMTAARGSTRARSSLSPAGGRSRPASRDVAVRLAASHRPRS
jgi:hypothetical protein